MIRKNAGSVYMKLFAPAGGGSQMGAHSPALYAASSRRPFASPVLRREHRVSPLKKKKKKKKKKKRETQVFQHRPAWERAAATALRRGSWVAPAGPPAISKGWSETRGIRNLVSLSLSLATKIPLSHFRKALQGTSLQSEARLSPLFSHRSDLLFPTPLRSAWWRAEPLRAVATRCPRRPRLALFCFPLPARARARKGVFHRK